MKFNVNSSMSVGGNSISFSFQTKQKRNMEIQANKKNQVIKTIEISMIYNEAKSFGFRAIKGSFHFLESILRTILPCVSTILK